MANRKRRKITRQEWKPNVLLRLLKTVWMAGFSLVKVAIGAVATVVLIIGVCAFVLVGALGDYLQDDVLPNISADLEAFEVDQTSFLYYLDSDGNIQQMQRIYTDTNRQWVAIEEIPEDLIHAAVAIEDKRFYEHQGVDWITTVKACANMFFGSSSTFGGSTITQQMIKNRTGDDDVTVQRKVEEIFRAYKFEAQYDKDVVMEWYLNQIYLGEGCYGVKSAAWEYFGKELEELTTAECAALISITNNPSLYSPYRFPGNLRNRQLDVLWEMYDQGWITREEYDEAKAQELIYTHGEAVEDIDYHTCPECEFTDIARHFDKVEDLFYCPQCGVQQDIVLDVSSDMYSWFTDLVIMDVAKALAEKQGMEWNSKNRDALIEQIKKGGYHIYTTIDMDVQNIVDEVYSDLENIPKTSSTQQLQSAIVVIDNRTGDIVAVAGAVGEKEDYLAFSFATDQGLQTGSVMKPLTVYAPAFELGVISPGTMIPDLPFSYDDGKFPLNDTRTYQIATTVLNGVYSSINTTAVHVLDMIGREYSFDFAKEKFGLTGLLRSEWLDNGKELSDIGYSPLALGALSYGCTVRDMASAYATFPSNGLYREDRTFTKVYDSEGNLVLDNTQDSEQILSEKAANYMNYCLRSVITKGTGYYANLPETMTAGKTGTTSGNKDRWFIGYSEYYTAAVWCGYKYGEEIRLVGNTTNPAGRLWTAVMDPIHDGLSWKDLYSEYGMSYVNVCKDSGGYATEACEHDPRGSRVETVLVYSEDMPKKNCDRHIDVDYCVSGDGAPNEFCLQIEGLEFSKVGLLRLTQKEIDEIVKAQTVKEFTDNLIYLVSEDGEDLWFHGLDGKLNEKTAAPYKLCTVHTEADVTPTEPTEPVDPNAPTEPGTDVPEYPGEGGNPGEGGEAGQGDTPAA
ncbi:MAG: transglycosylase domain-containing protein [Oscillospiraceae bacterium]|nr:transglycosylase domain-containing protein [Oscillospiraceae bacterium]